MKIAFRLLFFFALVTANVALAQSVTQDQMQTAIAADDWTKWNIFGLNAVVFFRLIGEAYSVLKRGGGIKGILGAIWMGENLPKVIADDYREELKAKPKDSPITPEE